MHHEVLTFFITFVLFKIINFLFKYLINVCATINIFFNDFFSLKNKKMLFRYLKKLNLSFCENVFLKTSTKKVHKSLAVCFLNFTQFFYTIIIFYKNKLITLSFFYTELFETWTNKVLQILKYIREEPTKLIQTFLLKI